MSGAGQAPLTQRGAAPVNILILQERPQSMGGRLLMKAGQVGLTVVDAHSGLVLLKLVCVSTTFLSPYFLECIPGEGAAGALQTGAAAQRITVNLWVMRTDGRITASCLSELTFRTI